MKLLINSENAYLNLLKLISSVIGRCSLASIPYWMHGTYPKIYLYTADFSMIFSGSNLLCRSLTRVTEISTVISYNQGKQNLLPGFFQNRASKMFYSTISAIPKIIIKSLTKC